MFIVTIDKYLYFKKLLKTELIALVIPTNLPALAGVGIQREFNRFPFLWK